MTLHEGMRHRQCQAAALAAKERQLVWLLVRQLGNAQAGPDCAARCARLWQEVAALEIDPDRVVRLLYGGHDLSDAAALAALDPSPADRSLDGWRQAGHGFRRLLERGGGPRSAPAAAAPAHRAGR